MYFWPALEKGIKSLRFYLMEMCPVAGAKEHKKLEILLV